ncbi:MAG: DKNYY domain-containing protein, partial [Planctomycetes bacterium]|nr:DKNYY domain-containing protein [Planctomycetota bacterium]
DRIGDDSAVSAADTPPVTFELTPDAVLWAGRRLRTADRASFVVLSHSFARDQDAVWVHGKRFPDGDPARLTVLVDGDVVTAYACDGKHVYRTNLPQVMRGVDGATFHKLDDHYGADDERVVHFASERVLRRIAPSEFAALGGGFARHRDQVLYRGEVVATAIAASFQSLGAGYGRDAERVWYGDEPIAGVSPGAKLVVAGDYLVVDARTVHYHGREVVGARGAVFRSIGRHFAADDRRVYLDGKPLEHADPDTFEELDGDRPQGRDALADYQRGERGMVRAVRDAARGRSKASGEAVVNEWWSLLEAIAFPVFDRFDPTGPSFDLDETPKRPKSVPRTRTAVALDRGRLRVEANGMVARGSLAGFLHPLAAAWAAARGLVLDGVPCIRLVDERIGYMGPNGDLLRRHWLAASCRETLAVADVLAGDEAEAAEVALALALLQRRSRFLEATVADAVAQRRLALGGADDPRFSVSATTNLAAIKAAAKHAWLASGDAAERLAAMEFLHARLGDLDTGKARHLLALAPLWLRHLDDASPRTAEVARENLDFVVSLSLRAGDAADERLLPLLDALVTRGINLDWNLGQRWRCLAALGQAEAAEGCWQRLESLVGGNRLSRPPAADEQGSWSAWRQQFGG